MLEAVKADFFVSRRGSVAAIAREVADVLTEHGYAVIVQDYDIPLTTNLIEAMHEAIKNARDLVVLFTADYETSPFTRKEFTSFEADRALSGEERRIVILRCEDAPLRGLFAANVYQDLVGIDDLQERRRRIIAAAEGRSQAQKPPPRPFVGAPPRIASFTGRAAELDRLDAILIGGDRPAAITQLSANTGRAAVQGLGGVGKTSLAIEYAYRYRDLYAGVWWCPAENRIGLLAGLTALARHLGAASADEADFEKAAKAGLRRLAEQRATHLLVYDNVASPGEIADLLPASGARVLITSRFPDWSGWAEEVGLDVLAPDEAVSFLETRAGRQDAAGAQTLVEALGRLPLALDHAAAYCRRAQMRFADYAAKAGQLIAAAPRGAAYPRSVAATFDLAITAAVASCPAAEALMSYLGQCAHERIPMALVDGAIEDEGERMTALLALAEVSLIRRDPFEDGTAAWTAHRLVQAAARARSGDSAAEAERLRARLIAIYPEDGFDNPASWSVCEQLTPHLLQICALEPPHSGGELAELLLRAGKYFHGRAAYPKARLLFERALAITETASGVEHPETARSLNDLALLLRDQGDLAAARPLFERALAIDEKTLGSEHTHTAQSLHNLGLLLHGQGDFARARPLIERALAVNEKMLGSEHRDTASCLNTLAVVLQKMGDLAAARPLLERALAVRERTLGPEHPRTAVSLNSLATVLQDMGDLAAARPLLERALAVRERTLGPEHTDTAVSLNNLAVLLRETGDLAAARPLFKRALNIYGKVCGPIAGRIRSNYGRLLLADCAPVEALALGEAALTVHDKTLGASHQWTRDSARLVADTLDALRRSEEAGNLRARYGVQRN